MSSSFNKVTIKLIDSVADFGISIGFVRPNAILLTKAKFK